MTPILWGKLGGALLIVALIFFMGYHLGGLAPKAALAQLREAQATAVVQAVQAEAAHAKTETDRLNQVIATYEKSALAPIDPTIAHRVLSKYTLGSCSMPGAPAHTPGTVAASAEPGRLESALGAYIRACDLDAKRLNALIDAWPR